MKPFKELLKTKEFYLENFQNELFIEIKSYMEKENLNQSQLAEKLGVTRGYISQVLNGNFNHSIGKLIEISLAIGLAPIIQYKPIDEYIEEQKSIRTKCKEKSKVHKFDSEIIPI